MTEKYLAVSLLLLMVFNEERMKPETKTGTVCLFVYSITYFFQVMLTSGL